MPKGLMPCQAYDMEPTITANLEYFIADHLSYPACLFSFLGYLIHLLLSVVQFIDFQTVICCSIVYIYCRSKQPLLKEHGSSFSVGAAKRLFSRDVSVYLLNFIDHFSHDDASKQIPIPIFQSRASFISQCCNLFSKVIKSCCSVFMSPSNHPYKFPAVDMDKSPVVILNSIGPVLHSVPFNSQTLKVSLFSSVTDKIHERLLHLFDNSTTFNSLTEFKIWLLKQLKPSKKFKPSKAQSEAYFVRQVTISLGQVFNSPVARNLHDVQLQLFRWAHLPYLLGVQAAMLLPPLQNSLWSSQPWLSNAATKILHKFPTIDFHELLFKLGQTPLCVPHDFPCNPRPKYSIFKQRRGRRRDSDIIKCSILADNVATSPGPTPAKYSNGTYRRLTTKNDLIPQNDITVQVIPTKSIANNDAIVATTPFTPIIDKDSICAPTSSANSIYKDSIVTISSTDITSLAIPALSDCIVEGNSNDPVTSSIISNISNFPILYEFISENVFTIKKTLFEFINENVLAASRISATGIFHNVLLSMLNITENVVFAIIASFYGISKNFPIISHVHHNFLEVVSKLSSTFLLICYLSKDKLELFLEIPHICFSLVLNFPIFCFSFLQNFFDTHVASAADIDFQSSLSNAFLFGIKSGFTTRSCFFFWEEVGSVDRTVHKALETAQAKVTSTDDTSRKDLDTKLNIRVPVICQYPHVPDVVLKSLRSYLTSKFIGHYEVFKECLPSSMPFMEYTHWCCF